MYSIFLIPVWYGYGYAKWLQIFVIPDSKHDWARDWAPPVNETICPTCPITEGERRIEDDDEEEDNEVNVSEEDKKNEEVSDTSNGNDYEDDEDSEEDDDDRPCRNNVDDDDLDGTIEINDPDFEIDLRSLDSLKKVD